MLKVSRHTKSPAQLSAKTRTKNVDTMVSLRTSPIPRTNSSHSLQSMASYANPSHKEHKFKKKGNNINKGGQHMFTVSTEAPLPEIETPTTKIAPKKGKLKLKVNKLNKDIPLVKLNSNPPLTRDNYSGTYKQNRRNSIGSVPENFTVDVNQLEFLKRINAENSTSPNSTYQSNDGLLSDILPNALASPKTDFSGKYTKRTSKIHTKSKADPTKIAPPISILTYASRSKKDIIDIIPSIEITNENEEIISSDESKFKTNPKAGSRRPSQQPIPDFLLKLLQAPSSPPEKKSFFDNFGPRVDRYSHSDTESDSRTNQRITNSHNNSSHALNRVTSHSSSLYAGPSFGRSPAPNSLPFPILNQQKCLGSKQPSKAVVSLDYLSTQKNLERATYIMNNLSLN